MRRNEVVVDTDDMAKRNKILRLAFLIGSHASILVLFVLVGVWLGVRFSFPGAIFLFGWAGLSFGVYILMRITPHFWVVVPQTSAFVTTSMFGTSGDPNVPYGPGAHPALPWEMREESGNITLDIFTVAFTETVPTSDTAVIVDGTVQFKFSLPYISKVIGIDESTVDGFLAQIHEYVSEILSEKSGNDAKNFVKELTQKLEEVFEGDGEKAADLLDEYGIYVTGFQISSIDFPQKVQDAKDARNIGREQAAGVAESLGYATAAEVNTAIAEKKLTREEVDRAHDRFMVATGKAKMDIKRLDVVGLSGAGDGNKVTAALLDQERGHK